LKELKASQPLKSKEGFFSKLFARTRSNNAMIALLEEDKGIEMYFKMKANEHVK
jgi:hypothetical protein